MRFLHLSDLKIGENRESGRRWGHERSLEITGTLKSVLKKASEFSTDLVLIAGGLFSHQPVTAELDQVNRLFLSMPELRFVIAAGESDAVRRQSPVRSFRWAPNVSFVLSDGPVKLSFSDIDTAVYAASRNDVSQQDASAVAGLLESDVNGRESIRIGLVYDSDADRIRRAFAGSRISYAACGGQPRHREIVPERAFYCGGLEPEGMADTGEHGLYAGEISSAGRLLSLEFIPLASASYVPLVINVSTASSPEEVRRLIENEIEKRGPENIYRLRLQGRRVPDADFSFPDLQTKYRIALFLDETEPQYDFAGLFQEHPSDMIGYFISSFRKNEADMSDFEKKAMYYGINALLKTAGKEQEHDLP